MSTKIATLYFTLILLCFNISKIFGVVPSINVTLFDNSTRSRVQITKFDDQTEYIHPFDVVEVKINAKRVYYVASWDKIAILNENFSYVSDIDFPDYKQALFVASIEKALFFTDFDDEDFVSPDHFIYKFDFDLKLLNSFNLSGSAAGLFYDDQSEMLYVTDFTYNLVYILNKDLTKVLDSFRSVAPWFVLTLNGKIFVSSINRITIYDAKTKQILRVLDGLCDNSGDIILKFSVDINENIVYPCLYWSDFRLISSNGTQIGQPIPIRASEESTGPFSVYLDSVGNILVMENGAIEVFY